MMQIQKLLGNLPMVGGYGGIAITMCQLLIIVTSYGVETTEKTRTKYSKFAGTEINDVTTVTSRMGMLMIYTPALIVSTLQTYNMSLFGSKQHHFSLNNNNIGGLFCLVHFLKRDVEVLYVHKYSGRIPLPTSIQIGVFYALIALLVSSMSTKFPSEHSKILGTFLFTVGEMGNLYHHYLLAILRNVNNSNNNNNNTGLVDDNDKHKKKKKMKQQYVAPRGGMFDYVATPHYFFELIAWYGIAVVSNHMNVYLAAAGMTSYLCGRAYAQNEWNRQMFSKKEWPLTRKNIIPFVL